MEWSVDGDNMDGDEVVDDVVDDTNDEVEEEVEEEVDDDADDVGEEDEEGFNLSDFEDDDLECLWEGNLLLLLLLLLFFLILSFRDIVFDLVLFGISIIGEEEDEEEDLEILLDLQILLDLEEDNWWRSISCLFIISACLLICSLNSSNSFAAIISISSPDWTRFNITSLSIFFEY